MTKKLMMSVAGVMMLLQLSAEYYATWTDSSTGIEWKYQVVGDEISIGGYFMVNQTMGYVFPAVPDSTVGAVSIPSEIYGRPVTIIGKYAFSHCSGLTGIKIPTSVRMIEDHAFSDCIGLKDMEMPSSVTSVGEGAFYSCSGLTSFVIPDGVRSIERATFDGCVGLTSVKIPEGVTNIADSAFRGCSGIRDMTMPSSVMHIGEGVFYGCSRLETIIVDKENVNFKSENGLLLSSDGTRVIQGVNGSVTIPSSATSIDDHAFYDCSGLTDIQIPLSVTDIGRNAFQGCSSLTSVTIPPSVMKIGDYVFYGCSGLSTITISSSVTSIGQFAFYGCSGLTSIVIPEGVTNIGIAACLGCRGLTWVTVPSSMTNIASYAFLDCGNLSTVYVSKGDEGRVESMMESSGVDMSGVMVQEIILPDGGSYNEMVDGIEWIFTVSNGESVVGGALNGIEGNVVIPSVLGGRSVTGVGNKALNSCCNLKSVTIPSSVTRIGTAAFSLCKNLSDVIFEGDMVDSIGRFAFDGCYWDLVMHVPSTWIGRGKTLSGYAVMREDEAECAISANLTVTNVVVQYVLNSVQPNIAVPVADGVGFVTVLTEVISSGAVSIPSAWKDNYPTFTSKYGSDFGKALMMKSGKRDGVGNDMFVWQDYVAGTDPTNPDDKFMAFITLVKGVPFLSYSPELSDAQKALRSYKTFGKKQLNDSGWDNITDLNDEARKVYNFFKVTVEMK